MINNFLLSHHPDEVDSIASDVIYVSAAKHSTAHPARDKQGKLLPSGPRSTSVSTE